VQLAVTKQHTCACDEGGVKQQGLLGHGGHQHLGQCSTPPRATRDDVPSVWLSFSLGVSTLGWHGRYPASICKVTFCPNHRFLMHMSSPGVPLGTGVHDARRAHDAPWQQPRSTASVLPPTGLCPHAYWPGWPTSGHAPHGHAWGPTTTPKHAAAAAPRQWQC
jgi:hypothetical protein